MNNVSPRTQSYRMKRINSSSNSVASVVLHKPMTQNTSLRQSKHKNNSRNNKYTIRNSDKRGCRDIRMMFNNNENNDINSKSFRYEE